MARAAGASASRHAAASHGAVDAPDTPKTFACTCCGETYTAQHGNFYRVRFDLYKYNDWYITVCKRCLDALYDKYVVRFKSEELAIERICSMFNVPFKENPLNKSAMQADGTRFARYMRYVSMAAYVSMSYDDLFRDRAFEAARIKTEEELQEQQEADDARRLFQFWGPGHTPDVYEYLQCEYEDWTARYECQSKAQEELFKNLSLTQLNARSCMASGDMKGYKDAIALMQSLMNDANIKPSKINDNTLADQNTFGTLIQKWERERPIRDPDPTWADVDSIKQYMTTYFYGHLCKIMGVENDWAAAYEQEMAEHTVHPPRRADMDDDDDDDGGVFDDTDA